MHPIYQLLRRMVPVISPWNWIAPIHFTPRNSEPTSAAACMQPKCVVDAHLHISTCILWGWTMAIIISRNPHHIRAFVERTSGIGSGRNQTLMLDWTLMTQFFLVVGWGDFASHIRVFTVESSNFIWAMKVPPLNGRPYSARCSDRWAAAHSAEIVSGSRSTFISACHRRPRFGSHAEFPPTGSNCRRVQTLRIVSILDTKSDPASVHGFSTKFRAIEPRINHSSVGRFVRSTVPTYSNVRLRIMRLTKGCIRRSGEGQG